MIPTLYPIFREKWSKNGSVFLISDTHFQDFDCEFMNPHWISPEEHIQRLRKKISKQDTLIHLGDVGDVRAFDLWPKWKRPYMVLIMGNHDETAARFENYFDEIYTGPLMIAQKLILSHEPIPECTWAFNIHGHDHNPKHTGDEYHLNLASNVVGYQAMNLKEIIQSGVLNKIDSIHRQTIDKAVEKKQKPKVSVNGILVDAEENEF